MPANAFISYDHDDQSQAAGNMETCEALMRLDRKPHSLVRRVHGMTCPAL